MIIQKWKLVIMRIPAHTLKLATETESGLLVSADKTDQMDIKIDPGSFIDKRSGVDFSSYIIKRVQY